MQRGCLQEVIFTAEQTGSHLVSQSKFQGGLRFLLGAAAAVIAASGVAAAVIAAAVDAATLQPPVESVTDGPVAFGKAVAHPLGPQSG